MSKVVGLLRVQPSVEGIKDSIIEVLKLIDFDFPSSITSVAIKPNLCYYWDAATGQTTDPRIVAGIIDFVREKCGNDVNIKVVEADASAMRTKYVFTALGYDKLSKEKNVELSKLSSGTLVEKTVTVGKNKVSFQVPQLLLDCDFFINVPKLKVMRETQITCAMKNIFGCIGYPRKTIYHKILDEAIVGINKILHPNLTIVDGLVALGSSPIKLGLIMAGADPFAVDTIACRVMGYNPSKVRFLKIANEEKMGTPNEVTTRGEKPAHFQKIFPKPGLFSSKYWWGIQASLLRTYKRLSGDVIPPALEE
jgi:uncharacterized protein (DUF362 family)